MAAELTSVTPIRVEVRPGWDWATGDGSVEDWAVLAGAFLIALRFPALVRYDADDWLAVKVPMVNTNEGVEHVSAGQGRGGS